MARIIFFHFCSYVLHYDRKQGFSKLTRGKKHSHRSLSL